MVDEDLEAAQVALKERRRRELAQAARDVIPEWPVDPQGRAIYRASQCAHGRLRLECRDCDAAYLEARAQGAKELQQLASCSCGMPRGNHHSLCPRGRATP